MPPFPIVFPGLPYANPNAPDGAAHGAPVGMMQPQMAQTASGVSLGQPQIEAVGGCIGCTPTTSINPGFSDLAPKVCPMWLKILIGASLLGAIGTGIYFVTRR